MQVPIDAPGFASIRPGWSHIQAHQHSPLLCASTSAVLLGPKHLTHIPTHRHCEPPATRRTNASASTARRCASPPRLVAFDLPGNTPRPVASAHIQAHQPLPLARSLPPRRNAPCGCVLLGHVTGRRLLTRRPPCLCLVSCVCVCVCVWCLVSCTLCLVSCALCRVSCVVCLVSGAMCLVSGAWSD